MPKNSKKYCGQNIVSSLISFIEMLTMQVILTISQHIIIM